MNYLPILIVFIGLFTSYWLAYMPLLIPVIYCICSLLTFLAYAKDKSAAKKGKWRVSEKTLHILSLLGGWPGAIIGQQLFRHKTKKTSFRIVFWITLIANNGVLIWLHTHQGSLYLNSYIFNLEEIVFNEVSNDFARFILLSLLSFHA